MEWPKEFLSDFESSLEDLENIPENQVTKFLERFHSKCKALFRENPLIKTAQLLLLFTLYNVYLITAIVHHLQKDDDIGFCNGVGFLIICTGVAYFGLFYYKILKFYGEGFFYDWIGEPCIKCLGPLLELWFVKLGLGFATVASLLAFVIVDTKDNPKALVSFGGTFVLILLGVVLSKHPGRIRWRHVIWGMGLQFMFGLLILRWSTGRLILNCISDKVTAFLGFVQNGSGFVYGYLATGLKMELKSGEKFELPGIFAFQALSVIYFFSFFVAILYHFGIMTFLVSKIGFMLEITVGTTAAESMNASANIFLGMTEAPLVVKPFIGKMTKSELHSVMTGGFATIAGAALGAYITFGIDASHLLSASLMSAPAALVYSKILYPETKKSITNSKDIYDHKPKKMGNFLDSASQGATQAIFLIANVVAGLIAITAFVGMLNSVFNWFGALVGWNSLTFEWLVAKIFTPLAWIIGIENEEVDKVAYLLGIKTVINEFVAYSRLSKMCLSPRSKTIATYALCCFANFSSIGITLGGLSAICPERTRDMASVVFSAFIAGNVAALLTACVAGTLSVDIGYEEWRRMENCTEKMF